MLLNLFYNTCVNTVFMLISLKIGRGGGGEEGMLIIVSYDVPSCSDIIELRTRLMMANEIHC